MTAGPHDSLKQCRECGAENLRLAPRCWMCHADLSTSPEIVIAELVPERPQWAPSEIFLATLTALVAGLIVLVGIGLASEGPAALIPYAIIVLPAFIATAVRVAGKQSRGQRVGWGEGLLTFFVSGIAVIGFIGLLIVAAVVAFCIFCFVALAGFHPTMR